MTISENVPLVPMTSFRIGGAARYFTTVTSEDEVQAALSFARERSLPVFVLGGGSNVLVADEGFPGLVIKVDVLGITRAEDGPRTRVIAGAGVPWDELVETTVRAGLCGFENLSGIPGSVGATPVQNVGAYGVEVGDRILHVDAIDTETGAARSFARDECAFGYRDSFFKSAAGKRYLIVRVHFALGAGGACDTSYRDLAQYFARPGAPAPTPAVVREAVLGIRAEKFPDLATCGTAGSFFKNPVVPEEHFAALAGRFPGLPGYSVSGGRVKVPLAWVLDRALNLKGVRAGDVGAHGAQPIVIVNYGSATARDVDIFARDIEARVRAACGIDIVREVVRVS